MVFWTTVCQNYFFCVARHVRSCEKGELKWRIWLLGDIMCDYYSCSILPRSNRNKLTLRCYILQNRCSYSTQLILPRRIFVFPYIIGFFVSERPLTLSMASAECKETKERKYNYKSQRTHHLASFCKIWNNHEEQASFGTGWFLRKWIGRFFEA